MEIFCYPKSVWILKYLYRKNFAVMLFYELCWATFQNPKDRLLSDVHFHCLLCCWWRFLKVNIAKLCWYSRTPCACLNRDLIFGPLSQNENNSFHVQLWMLMKRPSLIFCHWMNCTCTSLKTIMLVLLCSSPFPCNISSFQVYCINNFFKLTIEWCVSFLHH